MADYISREAVKEKKVYLLERREFVVPVAEIDWLPAADMDAILAENDTMRKQLAQIGKKPGDKMDNVRAVVKAHWIYLEDDYGDYYECSNCHDEYVVYEGDMCWKRCPTCGAEIITGKEANGRT